MRSYSQTPQCGAQVSRDLITCNMKLGFAQHAHVRTLLVPMPRFAILLPTCQLNAQVHHMKCHCSCRIVNLHWFFPAWKQKFEACFRPDSAAAPNANLCAFHDRMW